LKKTHPLLSQDMVEPLPEERFSVAVDGYILYF
jgi:hypothetical protein